ncbi:MAG: phosphoadenosine phosphosulfate reductase domain-containing protein, partial [Candidatus Hodgkinia cicadicola]
MPPLNLFYSYFKSNSICYNSMHDVGFKSIGCNPCTRAVKRKGAQLYVFEFVISLCN